MTPAYDVIRQSYCSHYSRDLLSNNDDESTVYRGIREVFLKSPSLSTLLA